MEKPNARGANNFIVGLFVCVALLVTSGFIVFMGGASIFEREYSLKIRFDDARGLNIGALVYLSGLLIGRVGKKELPSDASGIDITLNISNVHQSRIREDSRATTSTTGMLGDQVIVVSPGSNEFPMLKDGDFLQMKVEKKLADYLTDGGDAIETLSKAAFHLNNILEDIESSGRLTNILANSDKTLENLSHQMSGNKKDQVGHVLGRLDRILAKVESGEGTLGALVNDPSLHEDLRVLLGGAKRSKILRFLVREAITKADAKAKIEKNKE